MMKNICFVAIASMCFISCDQNDRSKTKETVSDGVNKLDKMADTALKDLKQVGDTIKVKLDKFADSAPVKLKRAGDSVSAKAKRVKDAVTN